MSHSIAKHNDSPIFATNALTKKNITAYAFAIMLFLLAINLDEKVLGHIEIRSFMLIYLTLD
jgi:hypothetical protein